MDGGAGPLGQIMAAKSVLPARQNRFMLFFRNLKDSLAASHFVRLAEKSIASKGLQEALVLYGKAIGLGPSAELYYQRGVLNHKMKNYKDALADFDAAIKEGKDDCDVHYARARAHVFLHNYETALTEELLAHKSGKNGKVTSLAIAKLYEICGNECLKRGNGSAVSAGEYFKEAKDWRKKAGVPEGKNGQ